MYAVESPLVNKIVVVVEDEKVRRESEFLGEKVTLLLLEKMYAESGLKSLLDGSLRGEINECRVDGHKRFVTILIESQDVVKVRSRLRQLNIKLFISTFPTSTLSRF